MQKYPDEVTADDALIYHATTHKGLEGIVRSGVDLLKCRVPFVKCGNDDDVRRAFYCFTCEDTAARFALKKYGRKNAVVLTFLWRKPAYYKVMWELRYRPLMEMEARESERDFANRQRIMDIRYRALMEAMYNEEYSKLQEKKWADEPVCRLPIIEFVNNNNNNNDDDAPFAICHHEVVGHEIVFRTPESFKFLTLYICAYWEEPRYIAEYVWRQWEDWQQHYQQQSQQQRERRQHHSPHHRRRRRRHQSLERQRHQSPRWWRHHSSNNRST
jgi:hypothetical protein